MMCPKSPKSAPGAGIGNQRVITDWFPIKNFQNSYYIIFLFGGIVVLLHI